MTGMGPYKDRSSADPTSWTRGACFRGRGGRGSATVCRSGKSDRAAMSWTIVSWNSRLFVCIHFEYKLLGYKIKIHTLLGDWWYLLDCSSSSAESGLVRARRLVTCPPGEIASATSSFSLPFAGGWRTRGLGRWPGFAVTRKRELAESSSSIPQPESNSPSSS